MQALSALINSSSGIDDAVSGMDKARPTAFRGTFVRSSTGDACVTNGGNRGNAALSNTGNIACASLKQQRQHKGNIQPMRKLRKGEKLPKKKKK